MKISGETRTGLRQALAVLKHDIGAIQQTLENAPQQQVRTYESTDEYIVNDYIIRHRLDALAAVIEHARGLIGKRQ